MRTNNAKVITNTLVNKFGNNTIEAGYISIDKQLKPLLIKSYENLTAFNLSKCNNLEGCPVWYRSHFSLIPTLSIIGNVSKSTGILILNGENDSETPVQQAFLLQQRLTEVKHPDHTLITYPNLGHVFYPSSQWSRGAGVGIEQYVLADIYAWLETRSGLSHSFANTARLYYRSKYKMILRTIRVSYAPILIIIVSLVIIIPTGAIMTANNHFGASELCLRSSKSNEL